MIDQSTHERWLAATLCVLACACGDTSGEPMVDGSVVDPPDGGLMVTPPDIPWAEEGIPPVAFTPCPPGWRERVIEGLTTCAPYPESGQEECEPDAAHFVGEPGCRVIGTPCPSGDFAEMLPTDGSVVYVLAGATAPGDGSRASPHPTLASVPWASLPTGTTVAIGKGAYPETVRVPPGVRLVGACVAETVLSGDGGFGVPAVINVDDAGDASEVTNLSIEDALGIGISVSSGARVSLDGVLIDAALLIGIFATDAGTHVTARSLVIRGTVPNAEGRLGRGVEFDEGARLEAAQLVIEDNREYGVFAHGGEMLLEDAVVRDTASSAADGSFGAGVWMQSNASLEARRLFSHRNRSQGVYVSRGRAVLEDVVIEGTLTRESDNDFGRGLEANMGASVEARRLLVYRNKETGVALDGATTVLEDTAVLETLDAALDTTGGRGIYAERGTLVARRVLVERHQEIGFFAQSGEVTLEDVAVRATSGHPAVDWWGRGMFVNNATLNARRLLVEDHVEIGMLLDGADVVLEDAIVHAIHAQPSGGGGDAIVVQQGGRFEARRVTISEANRLGISLLEMVDAELEDVVVRDTIGAMHGGADPSRAINSQRCSLTATRLLVERNAGLGVFILDGNATLVDTTIRDTRLSEDGANGWGLTVTDAAHVTGMRVNVEESHEFGVLAVGATLALEHAQIRDTRTSMSDASPGHGVMSADGRVRLTDFEVSRAATCGVIVVFGTLDLAHGVVEGSSIGACVQVEGYDLSRLQEDVSYRDNDLNLDSTALPVPSLPRPIPML